MRSMRRFVKTAGPAARTWVLNGVGIYRNTEKSVNERERCATIGCVLHRPGIRWTELLYGVP